MVFNLFFFFFFLLMDPFGGLLPHSSLIFKKVLFFFVVFSLIIIYLLYKNCYKYFVYFRSMANLLHINLNYKILGGNKCSLVK